MEWYMFALIAAGLAAAGQILQKKILFKERSVEYNTVAKFFQAALVLLLLPLLNLTSYPLWMIGVIYGLSLLAMGAIILETKAFRHLEISSVAPLTNLSPGLILIFAFLFLGEKVSFMQGAGIGTLLVGSYFLEANHHWRDVKGVLKSFKSRYFTYFFIGLSIGVILNLGNKYLVNSGSDIIMLTFLYYIFTWFNFTIITFLFFDGFKNIKHGIKNAGFSIFIVALFYVLHKLTYLKAMSMEYISLVKPIAGMGVILTTFIGGELFHEKHIWQRTSSCIIMLFGAYLIIMG
ncbi:MAG: EamA family transporter [Nanoarchaeota archaeon]|nr:EamA family transporter [Nanoarchaeota archaeon]